MFCRSQRGFTLVEFLIVGLALLATTTVISELVRAKDEWKESEVKYKLHMIRVYLDMYQTDHKGFVPEYIFGGDEEGWDPHTGCSAVTQTVGYAPSPPHDPLIHQNYLAHYPDNPFIDTGEGLTSITFWTSGTTQPGEGDVRFGFNGEIMGNCLDDPRYLFNGYGNPTNYQYTMLPRPDDGYAVIATDMPNTFYTSGGIPDWIVLDDGNFSSDPESETLKAFWPGQFFYRSAGEFSSVITSADGTHEREFIWAWPYEYPTRYILGAYGSPRTEGLDVIRLTSVDGYTASVMDGASSGAILGQYYQDHEDPFREASHPDFDARVTYSNPEVFGGGYEGLMPQFPYYESGTGQWIFGAPDGYADGVILVLTSDFIEPYTEW